MDLKHIFPIELNYKLRHICEWNQDKQLYLEPWADGNRKRVFFLDAPSYGNIGDQAIAYAMESFISKILPDYIQIEITEDKLPSYITWLKNEIKEKDIICLTGGGNMGVKYQRYESVRRLVLKTFPNNPIVIFPQTFDYGSDFYSRKELMRAESIYGNVSKLVLCARDEESFEKMRESFPNVKVIFCPDIVLTLDYRDHFERTEDIGICLRNDSEHVLSEDKMQKLYDMYSGYVALSTTYSDDVPLNYNNRREAVEIKLQEFGSKKIIITDRLHGMIFAFITGTPVIALPNSNGKVERVCKYLSSKGNVVFSRDINICPKFEKKANETMVNCFGELEDAIKGIAEK